MLKKLREKLYQKKIEKEAVKLEKQRNKPEFKLVDLYVGQIVIQNKRECAGFGSYTHFYKIIKRFAFFTKVEYTKYAHIKSNQILYDLTSHNAIIGDYAVNNVRPFQEVFPLYMRNNNLSPSTKVSRVFIEENEEKINNELDPNQEVIDLFK